MTNINPHYRTSGPFHVIIHYTVVLLPLFTISPLPLSLPSPPSSPLGYGSRLTIIDEGETDGVVQLRSSPSQSLSRGAILVLRVGYEGKEKST